MTSFCPNRIVLGCRLRPLLSIVLAAHCRPLSPTVLVTYRSCHPQSPRCSSCPLLWSPTIIVLVAHCFCRALCSCRAHCRRPRFSLLFHCSRTSVSRFTLLFFPIRQENKIRRSLTHLKTECCFFIISSYLHHLHQRCITQLIISLRLRSTSSTLVLIICKTILIYPFASDSFVLQPNYHVLETAFIYP